MMNKLRNHMKGIMLVIAIAFLLSTFLMYEGRSSRRGPQRNADGTMSDYEVAAINGQPLMRSELERRVRGILENIDSRSVASLDIAEVYQSALTQYTFKLQIAREVKEQGIKVSDADVDRTMKAIADQNFPTREAFYQYLQNSGVSVENYKAGLARQLANDRLMRKSIGEITVSEDQALETYDSVRDIFFRQPSGYRILFADFNNNEDAEKFRGVLLSKDWDDVISEDMIATLSLDVINVTNTPAFAYDYLFEPEGRFAALASTDIGEVSPIFSFTPASGDADPDDFAVAIKTEHVDEQITPYDEVSADIRAMLLRQEESARVSEFQNSLLKKAKVEIFDKELFPAAPASGPEAQAPDNTNNTDSADAK